MYFYFCLFSSLLRGEEGDKKTQKPERKKNTFQKTLNSFFWISLSLRHLYHRSFFVSRVLSRLDEPDDVIRHTNPFYTRLSTLSSESRARVYILTHRKKAALSKFERRRGGLFQVHIIDPHTKQQNSFCVGLGDDDSVFFAGLLGRKDTSKRCETIIEKKTSNSLCAAAASEKSNNNNTLIERRRRR